VTHDLMLFIDGLDDITILKAGVAVVIILMFTIAALEDKEPQ
jgi:hypothetical protein